MRPPPKGPSGPGDLFLVDAALLAVDRFAGRLADGDDVSHVQRTIDELRTAFSEKAAIEPAVDRLVKSLQGLQAARIAGSRRDFLRGSWSVGRLVDAVERDLLPALRRVGFRV
jgi:hypothetical protein